MMKRAGSCVTEEGVVLKKRRWEWMEAVWNKRRTLGWDYIELDDLPFGGELPLIVQENIMRKKALYEWWDRMKLVHCELVRAPKCAITGWVNGYTDRNGELKPLKNMYFDQRFNEVCSWCCMAVTFGMSVDVVVFLKKFIQGKELTPADLDTVYDKMAYSLLMYFGPRWVGDAIGKRAVPTKRRDREKMPNLTEIEIVMQHRRERFEKKWREFERKNANCKEELDILRPRVMRMQKKAAKKNRKVQDVFMAVNVDESLCNV